MKKTPLNDRHYAENARMVDYAGWDMPVQYTGIKEETLIVRERVGIFDVSHMGELYVCGDIAADFLDWLLTRKVSGKKPDRITYAILCYEDGGTVDDLLVYQTGEQCYMLVVNAANKDKDFAFIKESAASYLRTHSGELKVSDDSDEYGQVAVQGPDSLQVMLAVAEKIGFTAEEVQKIKDLKRFVQFSKRLPGTDRDMVVSRTGYTGENGYELYVPKAETARIWDIFREAGVEPCGLGSRDALRLEAGMPLYGHELSAEITPLEGGMGFFVDLAHEFQGGSKMQARSTRKCIALVSRTRAIPRDGYEVKVGDEVVGVISSGSFSPTLGKGIAFALVKQDLPENVTEVGVQVRKKVEIFDVVQAPFVKK